jgi:hypothetical protein
MVEISSAGFQSFPRMEPTMAAERLALISGVTIADVSLLVDTDTRGEIYYPLAQFRAQENTLIAIRQAVMRLAVKHGFPIAPRRRQSSVFDQELSALIFGAMRITPAEASTENMWSFFTLNVCPDIAIWRWPYAPNADGEFKIGYERLMGRPRNIFRRAWWRGYTLNELGGALSEDETVQITERASIGGNPTFARELASKHIAFVEANAVGRRQDLMRDVAKRLLRQFGVVSIHALDNEGRSALLDHVYEEAHASL